MSDLRPRELPPDGGFSTPHVQSFHGARFCFEMLELQTAAVHERAREAGNTEEALLDAAASNALPRQALSEAVQVFCAMTVEGATNLLGVMVLGEDEFYAKLERKPLVNKLETVLHLLAAERSPATDEMLEIARGLANARNSFVHPKPQEGKPRFASGRRASLEGAQEAMRDLHRFFFLLQRYSYRYTFGFILF